MTKKEKLELAGVAVAILIILYFLFWKRRMVAVAESVPDNGPYYLSYNVPKGSLDLPTVARTPSQVNPSAPMCGCVASSDFSSVNKFAEFITSKFADIADSYTQNVLSALPPFMRDVLNNPGGLILAQNANGVFA